MPVYGTIDDPLDTDLFSFAVDDGEMGRDFRCQWIARRSGHRSGVAAHRRRRKPRRGTLRHVSGSQLNYVCGPLAASGNPYRIKVGDDDTQDAGEYKMRFHRSIADAACSSTAVVLWSRADGRD